MVGAAPVGFVNAQSSGSCGSEQPLEVLHHLHQALRLLFQARLFRMKGVLGFISFSSSQEINFSMNKENTSLEVLFFSS